MERGRGGILIVSSTHYVLNYGGQWVSLFSIP